MKNKKGLEKLFSLSTKSYLHANKGIKINDNEILTLKDDVIFILPSDNFSDYKSTDIQDGKDVVATIETLKKTYSSNLYLGVTNYSEHEYDENSLNLLKLCSEKNIHAVALNDVHFIRKSDYLNHQAKVAINKGSHLRSEMENPSFSEEQYFKTLDEIKEIGKRIETAVNSYFLRENLTNPTSNFDWEYILIESKQKNAWCMPGGKIAVYTGILDITKNTNGLAAVMGHEIAHAVAKHSVERASRGVLLQTGTSLIDIFSGGALSQINRSTGMDTVGLISSIGIMNPFNRKQESEADYLGMIFSALSGYDIRETEKIWERMREANKGKEPPQFMSTHPSSTNRIKNIQNWLNEIIIKYPPIV